MMDWKKRPRARRGQRAGAAVLLCAVAVAVWLAVTAWLFLTLDRQARSLTARAQSEQVRPAPPVRWTLR